jgi:transcriptional regulator with XRE-family HTH domain
MSNHIDISSRGLYRSGMDGRWTWVNRGAGQRVAQARKRLGLTQKGLANRIKMSRASVANIEAGKQPIQIQMIFELADKLEVTPADLLPAVSESGRSLDLSDLQVVQQIKRQVAESL